MQMYLPFGDWSDDGHGKYEKILIEAPSMEHLLKAQQKLKAEYGEHFFSHFADDYEEPYLGEDVWQALMDSDYPAERMCEKEDTNDWEGFSSLAEILRADRNPAVCLDFVIDVFIWLLNWKGAMIVQIEEQNKIPMICNWTCDGFETVGYGCFW